MRRIMITGASGFLGRHLLNKMPDNAEVLAQFCHQDVKSLFPNAQHVQMDFTNTDWSAIRDFAPDAIIHTAAMANVNECENQPDAAIAMNDTATRQLTDVARGIGARLIYTSTDQIYDGKRGDYSEADIPSPSNVYGKTKVDSEVYMLEHHPSAVSVRCALIYGKAIEQAPTFTEDMIQRLKRGETVNLFTDEYRSPVLVDNLAEILWELSAHDYHGPLNIGGSDKLSRMEMGEVACDLLGLERERLNPTRAKGIKFAAARPADCSFDLDRANDVLTTPLLGFEEGMRQAFV